MAPVTYVVREGDTLSEIALHYYGNGDKASWERIYNVPHNRNVIGPNPNLIRPGEVLLIPFPCVVPPDCEYKVKPGDTLSGIALHFYGDGTKESWERIYNNPRNRETIGSDPNLIKPDQMLLIPAP